MMEINGKPLSSLRVVDLRDELDKRGLSKAGKKDELIQRLASWLEVNPEKGSESPQDDGDGGDGDDVIEAERQQAEKLRLEEEKRAEERRVAEEVKREEERKAAEVEKQAADLKKEEEEKWRQAEEEKKRVAEQQRVAEEKQQQEQLRQKQVEEQRLADEKQKEEERLNQERYEQEKKEKIKKKLEEERLAEEERKKKSQEKQEAKEKEEEERNERRRKEKEEKRRKEEEEENKEKERRERKKKEKEEKEREEDERREKKHKEKAEKRQQEEKEKAEEQERKEQKKKEKEAKLKQEEDERKLENASKEQRLKEELLKRLRDQKEEKDRLKVEQEKKAVEETKPTDDKEEAGDTTLLMELDPNDLDMESDTPKTKITSDKVDSDKENKEVPATPGQVTSLRRLGNRDANSSARKRGWGASRNSRLSSSENIEITSNSLKDLVPDMKPLLSQDVAIEEEVEEEAEMKNGHTHTNDDEIGPTLPKQKKIESAAPPRKKIVLSDDATESDVIIVYNLTRPFTLNQLKEMLKRTGELEDFWINKIKSQCIAKYKTVDQASETRMALNGVTWPQDNKNPLQVVFSSDAELELRKSTADEVTRIVTTNGAGRTGIRDWDKEKLDRQKEREIRRGERERSATKEPVQPTKSLEELFNKTKVTPALYWKPLSEETIRQKEEARNRKVLAALKSKRSKSKS